MQRLAEQLVEHRAGGAGLEGGAYLAEDLALARNERVEPGGDAEEMERGRLLGEPVDDRPDPLRGQPAELLERLECTPLAVIADEVELGPVARRQADRLSAPRERRGQLACLRQRDERTLADCDRRSLVGEADERDRHEKWLTWRPSRATTTNANPTSARYAARRPCQPAS